MPERIPEPLSSPSALETANLHAWHNNIHVLKGVNLKIASGQVAVVLGHPGSGRDALSCAIMGLTAARRGSIRIHGTESISHSPEQIQHLGIGYCGAGSGIVVGLSCEENLLLPSNADDTLGGGMSLTEIYELLPNLYPRRHMPCTRLSGGEQQMLAVARILRSGANLLLLNNIADGLAPVMVSGLANMVDRLRNIGYTLLLVEQNLEFAGPLADCFYVMQEGQVINKTAPDALASRPDIFGAFAGCDRMELPRGHGQSPYSQ